MNIYFRPKKNYCKMGINQNGKKRQCKYKENIKEIRNR